MFLNGHVKSIGSVPTLTGEGINTHTQCGDIFDIRNKVRLRKMRKRGKIDSLR